MINIRVIDAIWENSSFIVEHLDRYAEQVTRPAVVYHYTKAAGLLGIVNSRAIWATGISYLNDAKEFEFARQLAEDVVQKRPEGSDTRFRACFLEGLRRPSANDVFVVSFSSHGDVLSQWRGYCDAIGGYSLGFSLERLFEMENAKPFGDDADVKVTPCWYHERDQRKLVTEWYEHMTKKLPALLEGQPLSDEDLAEVASSMLSMIAPVFKHHSFKEEAEWRLIVRHRPEKQLSVSIRAGSTTLIPYIDLPLAEGDEPLRLADVFVGPTPNPAHARQALFRLLNGLLSEEKIRESEIPFRTV